MKKLLEFQLSLWGSYNFKTYSILFVFQSYFEHYIYVVIQLHIKNFVHRGWANQKAQPKTKKQIMHNFKILASPTYLFT